MERPILFKGEMVKAILSGKKTQTRRIADCDNTLLCRYGNSGDSLWVRETWAKDIPGCPDGITFRADHQNLEGDGPTIIKWKPSIFMPKSVCRITLKITDVRFERLQEITEEDAMEEGVKVGDSSMGHIFTAREHFEALWDSINKKRGFGWDVNPWVWVIEFKRI